MNLDEGGEGAPLSGLVRLMQGRPPRPRRRGLFGSEYERFMGARRPSAPAFQRRVAATRRNGYDDQEEQRVIDGPERTVAQQLGEPTRTNHRGGDYWSDDDPTFHGRVPRR